LLSGLAGGGSWCPQGHGDGGQDEDDGGGEYGTADAVDEGLLGGVDQAPAGVADLGERRGLGEGDGPLGPFGDLGGQALDDLGHGVAVLLVEDAAKDGDSEGAAELAGGLAKSSFQA
jgi:hypothetical protein